MRQKLLQITMNTLFNEKRGVNYVWDLNCTYKVCHLRPTPLERSFNSRVTAAYIKLLAPTVSILSQLKQFIDHKQIELQGLISRDASFLEQKISERVIQTEM